jgi:hypothetical protein
MREPSALRTVILPGVVVGLLAVLTFGAIHAWLIVPIWSRLAGGIPFAVAAALALAWAFDATARRRGWTTPVHGLVFGVYMSSTLVPATIVDALLRQHGLRLGDTTAGMAAAVALSAAPGWAAGWASTHRLPIALAFALAAVALLAVAGGPLPVARSSRGLALSIGVVCIAAAAGASIAAIRSIRHHL